MDVWPCGHLVVGLPRQQRQPSLGGHSRITNEDTVLQYRALEPALKYSGIPRHADRQQIEFCILALIRVSRLFSGRQFLPERVSLMHVRSEGIWR
jgi:hypothetical protein